MGIVTQHKFNQHENRKPNEKFGLISKIFTLPSKTGFIDLSERCQIIGQYIIVTVLKSTLNNWFH